MLATSITSLFIRGLSILSRFTLFMYLGKFMSTVEYGVFGLLQSSLAIGVYLIGLDIYVYTTREIPQKSINDVRKIIFSQFAVHITAYLVFLPLILYLLSDTFIPSEYIIWFGLLLIFEHITFEIVRIIIAVQQPLYANLMIFARSFLWIGSFLIISYANPSILSIRYLLLFWISGLSAAMIIGIGLLFKFKILPFNTLKIDTAFVRTALRGSFIFFVSSVSYKTIEFSNRYFLKYYHSSFEVGIYSFFQNIVNLMDVFIYTALIMILLPKLIKSKSRRDFQAYKNNLEVMQGGIFYFTIIMAVALFLLIGPLISLIGKNELTGNITIFRMLLLGTSLFCLSLIGHYALYVNNGDRIILVSTLSGAALNVILNITLIPSYGLTGAAYSTVCSMLLMGILKLYLSSKLESLKISMIVYSPSRLIRSIMQRFAPSRTSK